MSCDIAVIQVTVNRSAFSQSVHSLQAVVKMNGKHLKPTILVSNKHVEFTITVLSLYPFFELYLSMCDHSAPVDRYSYVEGKGTIKF